MSFQLLRPLVPLAVLAAALGGCSAMLHSDQPAVQVYTLRAPAAAADPRAAQPAPVAALRIARPIAAPGLDGSQIVLLRPDHRLDFYAASSWSADAPSLIEALAVETLRASGAWRSVQGEGSPFPADDLLQISIRRFDADYASGASAPTVRVALECMLGTEDSRRVIATFVARGASRASANRMSDVVAAFQQATDAALRSMSRQAARAARGTPANE
jgi:cholesterol transport system auxiliary component